MKTSLIFDTDIGYDPDDFFALLLMLNSSELKIDLIVTGDEVSGKRAALVKTILEEAAHQDIAVVPGADLGSKTRFISDDLISPIYRTDINSPELIGKYFEDIFDSSDKVVYLGLQGFTNLAGLIKAFPESKVKLKVYQMGGAAGYERYPGWVEHNIRIDPPSAKYVLESGIDISLVQAQTTYNMDLLVDDHSSIYRRLQSSKSALHKMLLKHLDTFHKKKSPWWSLMHDPLTVSAALGYSFVQFYQSPVWVDSSGAMGIAEEGPLVSLSHKESEAKAFMRFLEDRIFG